jgi:glucose-1-phosphate adenylyltransferase
MGDYIYCVPAQQKMGPEWYRGTADAVRQNVDLFMQRDVEYVLILSGDHVYKMNYLQMLGYHKMKDADMTVSAVRSKREEAAGSLGVLEIDQEHRIVGFEEKPAEPKTVPDAPEFALTSMGVYIFKADALREILGDKFDDFGKDVIPALVGSSSGLFAYDYTNENKIEDFTVEVRDGKRRKNMTDRTRDSSYWRDVGSIDSYFEASMDLVAVDPLFSLYGEKWPFRTYQRVLPPGKCTMGGRISDSIICDGCIISGSMVARSILSPNVVVEKGANVEESVILDDVIIEPNARIRRSIIDKEVRIEAGASLGYSADEDKSKGCTLSDQGIVVVAKGSNILSGSVI